MFKITIKTEDGEVLDNIEADCLIGATHVEGSEDYQGLFYVDCDGVTALHTLRAAMQVISEKLNDEDIAQAAEDDLTGIVEDKPKGVN